MVDPSKGGALYCVMYGASLYFYLLNALLAIKFVPAGPM